MSTHCRVSSATHGPHWWRYCHRRVKKLQLRIAKATQGQQWRKVKALRACCPEHWRLNVLLKTPDVKHRVSMAKYGNIPNPSGPLLPGSNGVDTTHFH
ncbi:hypothetical protein F3Q19_23645 [Salmonella enterica subsp. enterica]|nr:hypothetical protein [Salmonella enterica subsp. enterica]ECW0788936.1 hypothetical protein [Salmonella enterica subsp. enterica]